MTTTATAARRHVPHEWQRWGNYSKRTELERLIRKRPASGPERGARDLNARASFVSIGGLPARRVA